MTAARLHQTAADLRKQLAPAAIVIGFESLLLLFEGEAPPPPPQIDPSFVPLQPAVRGRVELPVSFDDAVALDLAEVLQRLSISKSEFIGTLLHTQLEVRLLGFLPGFAYLDGLPLGWNLPRRVTSRTRVPQGSLGLAAGMAGFYPSDSPGGWNIVGRSDASFWDELRPVPTLLHPGDLVSLREVASTRPPVHHQPVRGSSEGAGIATCISAGQQTLIVAAPRLGRYEQGLAAGGAFDAGAAARANRRVGNPDSAGVLECTLVGPELLFHSDCELAWEGASVHAECNGTRVDSEMLRVREGDRVRLARVSNGLRCWLALGGGGVTSPSPSAIRPPVLAKDALLCRAVIAVDDLAGVPACTASLYGKESSDSDGRVIGVMAGPHDFAGLSSLIDQEWIVTPALDRVGIRLRPARYSSGSPAQLPSTGMQFGSVQLHPNGELIVMGPDHPITGGYLQPMTVVSPDLWKLAQLQPGDAVRWRVVS